MPVSFLLNRVTTLRTDNDSDGYADAGDVLRHILTIQNTGDTDATSVVLNDLLGGSTETGLMNISPIAFNDAFTAVGNTALRVGGAANIGSGPSSQVAGNLLSNDVGSTTVGVGALAGDDVTGFTIDTVSNGITAGGGTFNIFSDGSFNYISQAGDQGTDTFTYTIRDAGIDGVAGNADDTTSTATVTITITGQVWYVNSAAGPGGDGTSANPFQTVTAAGTASGANDYIYVQGNATGQLVMDAGEHLIGTGADLDVAGFHLADDGARSTVTNSSAGFGVALAGGGVGNNEIAGINIVSTGGTGNHALTGTSFGTLTVSNATIDASGQGLILQTGAIAGTGFVSTDSDGGTNNVSLTSITGTLALGTGALAGATGASFNVSGGSVTATYSGNITQASNAALVNVTTGHSGTLTFSTGTLSATNGTGLQFDNADGTYNFNGANTLSGGDAGVDIVNGSNGNFVFSSASAITNPTGIAFNVNGGAGNIDYNGTITHSNNAQTISVQNHTGGTVSFDGTVSSTGSADGINLATNTNTVISFTNTLTINTSASNSIGFNATGGGTVTATGSGSTISSGAGIGLNVVNTNIGANDLHFDSIATNGASSGIVLNNTGTTASFGGLIVAGTGANDSGGVIQNSTNDGIILISARDVSLTQMRVFNSTNNNIDANGVTNLTLNSVTMNQTGSTNFLGNNITNLTITGSTFDNSGNAAGEHGVFITGLFGINSVTSTDFHRSAEVQFRVLNTSATVAQGGLAGDVLTMSGVTFADHTAATFGDSIQINSDQTANMRFIMNNSVGNNTITGGIDGILINASSGGDIDVDIANLTVSNTSGPGINFNPVGAGSRVWFDVNGVTVTNPGSTGINATAIGNDAAIEGFIRNNTINQGAVGNGITIITEGDGDNTTRPTGTISISNNTISGVQNGSVINAQARVGGILNLTINDNHGSINNALNLEGIYVQAGSSSPTDNDADTQNIIRLNMLNNDISVGAASGQEDYRIQVRGTSIFELQDFVGNGNNANTTDEVNWIITTKANGEFVVGDNPPEVQISHTLTGAVTGVFTASAGAIPTPNLPTPMLAVTPPPSPSDNDGPPVSGLDSPAAPGSINIDVTNLTNGELALVVEAAIQFWAGAGASAEQIAAMRSINIGVGNLYGQMTTYGVPGYVVIDQDNAGEGWNASFLLGTVARMLAVQVGVTLEYVPAPTGGTGTPADPAPAPTPSNQPIVVDDGVLSQAELDLIVNAAIDRWAQAGATAEQLAAMRATTFSVEDIAGLSLAMSSNGHVTVDANAAGFSWFIDATPGEDGEYSGSGTRLIAPQDSQAGVRIDLLTTIMHELGHQVGLEDGFSPDERSELMYGTINPGERRLPGSDDLDGASGAPLGGTAFALSPVNLGIIPAGRTVTVQWDSTVNTFTNQIVPTFNNTSTVSGGNFVNTTSNSNTLAPTGVPTPTNVVLDSLTLGNLIFFDANNNGVFDGGDTGIDGVALTLFADTNANGVFDSGVDSQLTTTVTAGGGLYSFANLAPGDYIVRVDASNFTGGGALVGRVTATGGSDPDNNTDNDDNGVNGAGGIVVSQAITLTQNGETTLDGSGQLDINNTLDFGFIQLNVGPTNNMPGAQTIAEDATLTFSGGAALTVSDPDVGGGMLTVTLTVTNGLLTLGGTAGLTFSNGDGTDDITITFSGTLAAVNNALNGMVYTPTANFNGSAMLTITTNDNGNTGADPGLTGDANSEEDTDNLSITVSAANDPVTGAAPASATVDEDSGTTAIAGLSISDVDATLAPAGVYEVTLSATNGTVTLTTLTGLTFTAGDGAADATMTFHGTLADINTALATAGYAPAGNYNGSATVTLFVTDTFGGIVATGTGVATSDTDVVNVTVTAVNDPVGTVAPGAISLNEDSVNFAVTGLSITDVDATLAPAGVYEVTLTSTHGTLTLTTLTGLTFTAGDGTSDATMTFHGTLADINTALATTKYTPDANYAGFDAAGITLQATDTFGGIVATGTGAATNDANFINVTVTGQNDSPSVAVAASANSTEQVAGTIDAAATISDFELGALNGGNGDYGGSTLTVGRNGGAAAEDLISFGASGSFTVNGGNLEAPGGLVFATFTGGNGANLVINFTSTATPATQNLVNAVIQALQYTYTGDTPPASITLDYTFNDGAPANAGQGPGGTPTATDSITINITDTPENQPPVLDLNGGDPGDGSTAAVTEQAGAGTLAPSLTITDVDDTDLVGAIVTINSPATGDALGVAGVANGTSGTISWVWNGTNTLTFTGTASLADYQALLRQVDYNANGDDPGTSRTISWTVNDGINNSNQPVTVVTITPLNDEPTLAATANNPTFNEGGAAVDVFSSVTASTIEAGQTFTSMTLTVTNVTNPGSEVLVIDGSDVAINNGNAVVTSGNGLLVNVSMTGSTATLTFSGASLSAATLQTIIDAITYRNLATPNFDGNRVITITELVDSGANGGGNDNTAAPNVSSTVDVVPLNQVPAVDLNTGTGGIDDTVAYTENGTGVALGAAISVTDPDSGDNIESATIAISNPVAGDLLSVAGMLPPGITVDAINSTPDFLILTGSATPADYATALALVRFSSSSDDPTAGGTNTARSIGVTVNDGAANSAPATSTVNITATDDPSVAKDDDVTTDEGNAVSGSLFVNNGHGPDTDPDSTPQIATINGNAFTFGVQFALPSGALLTVNSNGTFDYNPNGVFNATPTPTSGASNQPSSDSFTYQLVGGSSATVTVTINGLDSNDLLIGTAGADTLTAGIGNDLLQGLGGADNMHGEAGDDTYLVDNMGDLTFELAGQGRDVVYASASYELAAGQEIEVLSAISQAATTPLTLLGNNLGQEIYGNAGANFIAGGGGSDYLIGLGGSDTYFVTGASEHVVEGAGGGTRDVVYAVSNYALDAGSEIEVLSSANQSGTGAQNLTGNAFGQEIYGNAGANVIDGGGGTDVLIGLGGNDVYLVDSSGDYVSEAAGGGARDVIYTMASYVLGAGEEVEVLSTANTAGSTAINLTGNALGQELYGNAGVNVLNGGAGADFMMGFAGADIFQFTTALGGGNLDVIGDFLSGTDKIQLDDAIFDQLVPGALPASLFTVGTAATNEDQRIIYDSATGYLYYDADGTGVTAQVAFALLTGHPALVASDFTVI